MTTTDTVLRQWHMLRLVPRYPQKITVQAIKAALEVEGFDTTERTIQRDLAELSRAFPLQRLRSAWWQHEGAVQVNGQVALPNLAKKTSDG